MTTERGIASTITNPDLLLQILDMLPTPIFVRDQENRFVFSNKAHSALVGIPSSDLLGKTDADFYSHDDAAMFMARDKIVMDSGNLHETEETSTSPNGMKMICLTRKGKITSNDGSAYLIGTNTILNEIKQREEQYRALAETVPVGIWQADEAGRTSFANPLFMAYTGLEAGTLHSTDITSMIGGARTDFPGTASRFETDLMSSSGEEKRFLVISSGWLSLSSDGVRSAIVSLVDISEMTHLKRVNDEISRLNNELARNVQMLREAQDELVRRGRMAQLGQLTATVAHEIRNPLGAVRTAAFLIERKLKGKELGIESQLQRISNGIVRCDNIISQLLDFSRSRALQAEEHAIDDWLTKVVSEEAEKLPACVTIECDFGLNGLTAAIDAPRMSRVIVNLLSNAAEAMVGKGDDSTKFTTDTPRITVSTRASSRGLEITVADNGPGMSADILAKILEPLFTTKSFGTGLGLPAVEKILQDHGGGLDVRSAPGEGAVFVAWFPQHQPMTEAA